MKNNTHLLVAFLMIVFNYPAICQANPTLKPAIPLPDSYHLKIGVYQHSLLKYNNELTDNTCDKLLTNDSKKYLHRNIIELAILCLAFKQQGISLNLEIVIYPNISRAISMIETGHVDTLQISLWQGDIAADKAFFSEAIIRKNEYEKGIYVYEKHRLLAKDINDISLREYVGITKRSWRHDWKIMQQLTPYVTDVNHTPNLYIMLKNGRADFTLHDFSNHPDFLPFEYEKIKLKPIKGIKVVIPASRHFVVSKKWPLAPQFVESLNNGIRLLRQQKLISKRYRHAGFFNHRTKLWRVLNLPL